MSYVYLNPGEAGVWTVGFYKPDGTWEPESDHATAEKASERVAYLNGERPVEIPAIRARRTIIHDSRIDPPTHEGDGLYVYAQELRNALVRQLPYVKVIGVVFVDQDGETEQAWSSRPPDLLPKAAFTAAAMIHEAIKKESQS